MTSPAELDARLAKLEASVERIVSLLESGSTPFGSASHGAQSALANIYGQEELRERMAELVLRMGEPDTLEALTRIGVLLPKLEYALQAAAGGPELLEEGMELAREQLARHGADAAEVNRRLEASAEAVASLSRPEVLAAVKRMADGLPGVGPVVEALGEAGRAVAEVEGEEELRSRLTETLILLVQAETLDSLGRIAALAPQIEFAVNALAAVPELMEEGMEMAKTKLEREGTDPAELQRRLDASSDALLALTRPESMAAISELAAAVPALTPFVRAAAKTGSMLADYEGENELSERLAESLLRIAEPETLDALTRVACLTPQIEFAVNALAAGPEVLEEALESVREEAARRGLTAHDVNQRAQAAAATLTSFTEPAVLKALAQVDVPSMLQFTEVIARPDNKEALLKLVDLAPILERPLSALPVQERTLGVLRSTNQAVEEEAARAKPVGLFGLIGALRDPDVQMATGFVLALAKRIGAHLKETQSDGKSLPPGR